MSESQPVGLGILGLITQKTMPLELDDYSTPHIDPQLSVFVRYGLDECVLREADTRSVDLEKYNFEYDPVFDEFEITPKEEERAPVFRDWQTMMSIVFSAVMFGRAWLNLKKYSITDLLLSTCERTRLDRIRSVFTTSELPKVSFPLQHSHPKAHNDRNAVRAFRDLVAAKMGLTVFNVQATDSEVRNGRGTRHLYWNKDTNGMIKHDPVKSHDLICHIDTDFYEDMPTVLSEYPNNSHFIYTITPEDVSDEDDDVMFTFDRNNIFRMNVRGGGQYEHRLWNYDHDIIVVKKMTALGPVCVTFNVEKRKVSKHRSVILLTPLRKVWGIQALVSWMLGGKVMNYYEVAQGDFLRLNVRPSSGEAYVSLGHTDALASTRIKRTKLDTAEQIGMAASKGKLNTYHVKSNKLVENDEHAALVVNYVNNTKRKRLQEHDERMYPGMNVVMYEEYEEHKPLLTSFMNPIFKPAFVHTRDPKSEVASIVGRVANAQANAKEKARPFKSLSTRCRLEFLKRLIPEEQMHKGVPYDYEAMMERFSKPSQARQLEGVGLLGKATRRVSTFLKAEAYGKVTDPRNITTYQDEPKMNWMKFCYSIGDYFKKKKYYAFGKTPKEIAERVAEIATLTKEEITCPDVTRMDGSTLSPTRDLEVLFCLRYFDPKFHDEVLEAHRSSYGNKAVTTSGVRYEQEETRGSGEGATSVFNTLQELEILYEARVRQMIQKGQGEDHDKAFEIFELMTMAGGDDGIAGDLALLQVKIAAECRGYTIKGDEFERGLAGVNFLSRFYGPEVWDGNPTSMCDFKRQCQKFHLTHKSDVTPEQKLFEKSLSLYLTDRNTPYIGYFVSKVLDLDRTRTNTGEFANYWSKYDSEEQWPNEPADWMEKFIDSAAEVAIADFEAWVDKCQSLTDLMECDLIPDEETVTIVPVPELKDSAKDTITKIPFPVRDNYRFGPSESPKGGGVTEKAEG